MTVLSEAARAGDDAILRLLIERGADVKSAGFGPLTRLAMLEQCDKCVILLIPFRSARNSTGIVSGAIFLASSPLSWCARAQNAARSRRLGHHEGSGRHTIPHARRLFGGDLPRSVKDADRTRRGCQRKKTPKIKPALDWPP